MDIFQSKYTHSFADYYLTVEYKYFQEKKSLQSADTNLILKRIASIFQNNAVVFTQTNRSM